MKKMASGLYQWEGEFPLLGEMPCRADQLRRIVRYAAPSTLGKAEDEEAAVRLLWPSAHSGEWFSVTWLHLVTQMKGEYEVDQARECVKLHNLAERYVTHQARQVYWLLSIATFGIYALFACYPMPNLQEVPDTDLPFSLVPLYGPQAIVGGIQRLISRQLVLVKKESDVEVLFPTPELVRAIAKID